jgi:hypothetical protein
MTARSAKNLLVLLLVLMLVVQLSLFFTARYKSDLLEQSTPATAPADAAASLESDRTLASLTGEYVTDVINFLGVALSVVLSLVLLLIVMIMLVGRLIGVSRLTSAFIWCLLLILLLFPWQAFLLAAEFKVPGVLYTWDELMHHARFGMDRAQSPAITFLILKWSRFVVFPVIALVILLVIQAKSNRGLRQALGEADTAPSTA